jgi:hypothetical protein
VKDVATVKKMARGTRAGSKRMVLRNAVWCDANRLTWACDPCEENGK